MLLGMLLAACGGGGSDSTVATPVAPAVPLPPPLKYPIPAGLWSPPSGATPTSGNYVYLQSDHDDYVGAGRTYLYQNSNALLTVKNSGLTINVNVAGNENWSAGFLLPSGAETLQAGYFKDLTRTPFADSAVGGIDWGGDGRGCNTTKGWVVIDRIELSAGVVTAIDLRFEQHCEGAVSALRGQIHWNNADVATSTVGPAPIPANLWQPGAGSLPAAGNYLYLESAQGDYIGAGRTYLYTPANAVLQPKASGAYLDLSVAGDQNWSGSFQGLRGMTSLAVGYYGNLQRYPFNNPVLGGISWSGEGRGCNQLNGWFVVDKVVYDGTTLTAIDLRFEQSCDSGSAPLRGQLHWTASDKTGTPGPQNPPPAGLWTPPATFVPPAGNYVYLVSDSGDYIGAGETQLLTSANSTLNMTSNLTNALRVNVAGWTGDFVGMNSQSQLKPGYYGDLQSYPFHNIVRGGMSWSGSGRGCNALAGWFVVDKVSYELGQLNAIDLRFEQRCEGNSAAQRGVIHWAR